MNPDERQRVLDQLASSETRLLELVRDLTPAQWHFRETLERWSIAENLEHVILFENFLRDVVIRVSAQPPEPEKKAGVAGKEALVFGIATGRATKFNARDIVRPTGRWPDPARMLEEFRTARAETRAFVASCNADLRHHFFPHVALGDLDCFQWLVVMAQHGSRHAFQMEEIMADPGYPVP